MKFVKDNTYIILVFCFFFFFVCSSFYFDNWMHFDGAAFFFHSYFFQEPYNQHNYTRFAAVLHHSWPMISYLKAGGQSIITSSLLFTLGLTVHVFYPLAVSGIAYSKKWFDRSELINFLSFYVVSFFAIKAFSYAWFAHEFNLAHSLIWSIICLVQIHEKVERATKHIIFSLIILCLLFLNFSHPLSLPASLCLFFTYALKRNVKLSAVFFGSFIIGVYLLLDYLNIVKGTVHASGLDHLLHLVTSNFYISLFIIFIFSMFLQKTHKRLSFVFSVASFGLLYLNYEKHYFLYYVGRNPAQLFSLIIICAYLVKANGFIKTRLSLHKSSQVLMIVFSFLVLLEGHNWQQSLNALKIKLFTSQGRVTYTEINEVVPNYRNFANTWTQRMFSIILFMSNDLPVKSIIDSNTPHETDMLDFGYKTFNQNFRKYGGKFDPNFDTQLIQPRGKWKKQRYQ